MQRDAVPVAGDRALGALFSPVNQAAAGDLPAAGGLGDGHVDGELGKVQPNDLVLGNQADPQDRPPVPGLSPLAQPTPHGAVRACRRGDALVPAAVRDGPRPGSGHQQLTDFAGQGRRTGAKWHGPPLRELNRPALIMCGDADPMLRPRASRDTAAAIPGARLVILPDVRHTLPPAIWPTIAQQMHALADNHTSASHCAEVTPADVGRAARTPKTPLGEAQTCVPGPAVGTGVR
jgi:pimeloyl-ACP methyl ester carboxylesterase